MKIELNNYEAICLKNALKQYADKAIAEAAAAKIAIYTYYAEEAAYLAESIIKRLEEAKNEN